MFWLVADTHLSDIGNLYWEKWQRHAPCCILRMSVNGVSMIVSFASWVIYVPIGWRHPFTRYWQPLLGKTTATCSLPHPENDCQWSVNNFHLASWVIYVPTGCRHPSMKYWQPSLEKQQRYSPCRILTMSVNAASTVLFVACLVIQASHGFCNGQGRAQVIWMLQDWTRSAYRGTRIRVCFKVVLLLAIQENE